MHNTIIKVEKVNSTTQNSEPAKAEFMSMGIDKNFSAKAWAFAMEAKANAITITDAESD